MSLCGNIPFAESPNYNGRFRRDLRLMRTFADLATWMFPDLNWLSMKEGLDEFAALMKSQLDLSVEAKNLSKFRENFAKHPEVVFPRPFLGKQEKDTQSTFGLT